MSLADDLDSLLRNLNLDGDPLEEEELEEPDWEFDLPEYDMSLDDADDADDADDEEDVYAQVDPDLSDADDPNAMDCDAAPSVDEARAPPHHARTQRFRAYHTQRGGSSLPDVVLKTLCFMRDNHLDLPLLLWALSYSDPILVRHQRAKYDRTALLVSAELPQLLRLWFKPPRRHRAGIKTKGARTALSAFAREHVQTVVTQEMEEVGKFLSTKAARVTEEDLLAFNCKSLVQDLKGRAPTTWELLAECSHTARQSQEKRRVKHRETIVMTTICLMSYSRSNANGYLQSIIAVYLKSSGASAKAFDTLHALGIAKSQRWVYHAIDSLAVHTQARMVEDLKTYPRFGGHDNINTDQLVYEQRSDHQSRFDSGTVGTVYVIKDPAARMPNAAELEAQTALGMRDTISPLFVLDLEAEAAPRLDTRAIDSILQILLDTPQFDLATYEHAGDPDLAPAPRPGQLRPEAEGNVYQYMLGAIHQEEASYEGNILCMTAWLKQMRCDGPDARKKLALETVLVWVGDQLTASRLRGICEMRSDDYNAFERWRWVKPLFGWFHLKGAFQFSLHSQYYGTRTGHGLSHAFDNLGRKYLHSTSTKGLFHHTFDEAIEHTLDAHVRSLWQLVGGVSSLAALRERTPSQLRALAREIHTGYASSHAMRPPPAPPGHAPVHPTAPPTGEGTDGPASHSLAQQMALFVRDVLDYHILGEAIRCGDVRTMEDMLPRLLFRFSGGRQPNYATEVLELLQGLHREWTPEFSDFVRSYCWLVNPSGRLLGFEPVDLNEEHNVRDVKYTFATIGPFASWPYIERISPTIPVQRRFKNHIEIELNHGLRGKKHTSPAKEDDVARLQKYYTDKMVHSRHGGLGATELASADRFRDVVQDGAAEGMCKTMKRWKKGRMTHTRDGDVWEYDAE